MTYDFAFNGHEVLSLTQGSVMFLQTIETPRLWTWSRLSFVDSSRLAMRASHKFAVTAASSWSTGLFSPNVE
jgi:hypothetical protein